MNAHTPPARKDHIDALGASLLIGFSALMGCNQVIMKLVNQGMNPVFQAGLRSVAAAVPVLLFVWWRGAKVPLRGGVLIPGIVTGLFFALEFLLIFKALDFTSVTRSSVLFYTMPIWVAFGAHFLIPGERLTHRRMGGLVLACIGGFCLLLMWKGYPGAIENMRQMSPAMRIPMTVPNLAVPVGATLMFVKVLCLVLTDGRSPREAVKP